jgi:DNA-binding response OmpR family regulator
VTDLTMPGVDGVAVAHAIRALADVPIVLVTGRGEHNTHGGLFSAGLAKPFTLDELRALIRSVVEPG